MVSSRGNDPYTSPFLLRTECAERDLIPADKEKATKDKIDGLFRKGHGTVLFYEDQAVVNGFAGKMPGLANAFGVWSDNQAGILQFVVWTALKAEGLGATLQVSSALRMFFQRWQQATSLSPS